MTSTETPGTWVDDVREALTHNADTAVPALLTVRDALLGTAPRSPEQALAAARILLAAHTRELAAKAQQSIDEYRAENGLTRSTRGLLTGMSSIRRQLTGHADGLDPAPKDDRP